MTTNEPKKTAIEQLREFTEKNYGKTHSEPLTFASIIELADRLDALEAKNQKLDEFAKSYPATFRAHLGENTYEVVLETKPFPSSVALDEQLASESRKEPCYGCKAQYCEISYTGRPPMHTCRNYYGFHEIKPVGNPIKVAINEARQEPTPTTIELPALAFDWMVRGLHESCGQEYETSELVEEYENEFFYDWCKVDGVTFVRAKKGGNQ